MTDTDSRAIDKNESRVGRLYLLKMAVELTVVIGLAKLGAYVALEWGDVGRATASDIARLLGFLLGVFAVYLIESATIGVRWPHPKSPDEKPAWVFMIATITCIAAGGAGGLILFGRLGGWIGGLLGLLVNVAMTLVLQRFIRQETE